MTILKHQQCETSDLLKSNELIVHWKRWGPVWGWIFGLVVFQHFIYLFLFLICALNTQKSPLRGWDKVFIEGNTEVCLERTVEGCGFNAPDLAVWK